MVRQEEVKEIWQLSWDEQGDQEHPQCLAGWVVPRIS